MGTKIANKRGRISFNSPPPPPPPPKASQYYYLIFICKRFLKTERPAYENIWKHSSKEDFEKLLYVVST